MFPSKYLSVGEFLKIGLEGEEKDAKGLLPIAVRRSSF